MTPADQQVPGGLSGSFYSGTLEQYNRAVDAVAALPWTRHVAGAPDVGTLFAVAPRGAHDVVFIQARIVFNI